MKILAIETSCDETAAAVVEDGRKIISSIVASQIEEHKLYGGVVPEIASRRHCESIVQVTNSALITAGLKLSDIDAVAVTYAPGLIGALLVGVNFAKGLAIAANIPLIPVHHIKGHIAANYIAYPELKPPYLCLVASGGHSHIVEVDDYTSFNVIGRTLDDAAGEAFDKAARAMGFPYPGGKYIDEIVSKGDYDISKYKLPKPRTENEFDFSFSGLKTAVINLIHNCSQKNETLDIPSLAASFQNTVSEILTDKLILAGTKKGYKKIALCGGVAANSYIRKMLDEKAKVNGMELYVPPLSLCGDNAAMIGCQGFYEFQNGNIANGSLNAVASLSL